jgi:hypothetical protein
VVGDTVCVLHWAEHWYARALDLTDDVTTSAAPAASTSLVGSSTRRFLDGRAAAELEQVLVDHINRAAGPN